MIYLESSEPRFSECRTSDALHVATAVWLRGQGATPLIFASLDQRQRKVAAILGLTLLPAD